MKYKPTIIVDEIAKVIQKVSDNLVSALKVVDPKIEGVHYLHGHPYEIAQILQDKGSSPSQRFQKYPLVALLQDFPESHGLGPGIEMEASLHIIICHGTDKNWTAPTRYEKTFRPILYPVYTEFLEVISKSAVFSRVNSAELLRHEKIDRLFWGVESPMMNKKTIFIDDLDVIEIKNLKLNVKTNYC